MSKKNETGEQRETRKLDEELNRQLEQTFPASDPLTITRRRLADVVTIKKKVRDKPEPR